MFTSVTPELTKLCNEIASHNKSAVEWAEIESDDMFQTQHYCGGFDADEMEFCFSQYADGQELWFQLSIEQVHSILSGELVEVECRPADL